MNKDEKKGKDGKDAIGVIAAIVILVLVKAAGSAEGLAVLIVVAAFVAAAVLLARRQKKAVGAAGERPEQAHSKGIHISFAPEEHLHSDGSLCVNTLRGREKYYAQLDGFLKNGLIDREEYKFMRERYAKMNIPDDF